ncbi:MAG: hydrolase [Ruminococcus sp.]|nr:hydrolase [Ruminococcus sp.]
MEKYKCPCCGCYALAEDEEYEICPVCFWERDSVQESQPDFAGGSNIMSLNEARENYARYGACSEELVPFVREPLSGELDGNFSGEDEEQNEVCELL